MGDQPNRICLIAQCILCFSHSLNLTELPQPDRPDHPTNVCVPLCTSPRCTASRPATTPLFILRLSSSCSCSRVLLAPSPPAPPPRPATPAPVSAWFSCFLLFIGAHLAASLPAARLFRVSRLLHSPPLILHLARPVRSALLLADHHSCTSLLHSRRFHRITPARPFLLLFYLISLLLPSPAPPSLLKEPSRGPPTD